MFCGLFPPEYSGATKQAISLSKKLRNHGYHIEFLTIQRNNLPQYDEFNGFSVTRIPCGNNPKYQEFRFWYEFLNFARERRADFDIVHSHGANYLNSFVGIVGKLFGWKSLVKSTLAKSDLANIGNSISGYLQKFFLKQVEAYIAISQDLFDEFKTNGFSASKTYLIPNGVDVKRFLPKDPYEKKRLRKKLGLPEEMKIFLTVGVLDQRKNIGWLVEQWQNEKELNDHLLLIVGPQGRLDIDGAYYSHIKSIADHEDVNIFLYDYSENIEVFYQASDYYILASKSEGMPNVILEAMACGLPCLTTPVSGIESLVYQGETGYIYGFDDKENFMKYVREICNIDYQTVSENCTRLIQSQFSFDAIAKKYLELYYKLLS